MADPVRVGLMGGSFDPPHAAHWAVAEAALQQLPLDAVWWVPTGMAWQKQRVGTPAVHRVAMLEQVLEGQERHRLEPCELERPGPSYTIDTVERLSARWPAMRWTLLVGDDQWRNFRTWHRWEELLGRVELAVAPRVPAPGAAPPPAEGPACRFLQLAAQDTNSTALRAWAAALGNEEALAVAQGRQLPPEWVTRQLPVGVARYIAAHGLYRTAL